MRKLVVVIAIPASLLAASCGDDGTEVQSLPTNLEQVSGAPTAAVVGTAVSPTVRVTDQGGGPVPGASVYWSVLSGGGELSAGSSLTDDAGEASVAWTLGSVVGTNRLGAGADGVSPLEFAVSTEAAAPAVVILSPSSLVFSARGDSARVEGRVEDTYGNRVTDATLDWVSGDTSIARIGSGGWVVAGGPGDAAITATADTARGVVAVRVAPAAATVQIQPATDTLTALGETVTLSASVLDRNGNPVPDAVVEWSSLSPDVATVDGSGAVRAEAAGSATIEATSGGVTGRVVVVVAPVAASIVVSPAMDTVDAVGALRFLSVAVSDSAGHAVPHAAVQWTSLDPAVAAVTADGQVEALAAGNARITAAVDGVADTATLVVDQRATSVEVSPFSATLQDLGDTLSFTASVRDGNGYAIPDAVPVWSSSDTAVATVDQGGHAVAVDNGTATIRAGVDGVTGGGSLTVEQRLPGAAVAFESNRDGDWEIYVANAAGTWVSRLTNVPGLDDTPVWSPNGSQIAFRSLRDGSAAEIYVMNADGTDQTRLTTGGGGGPVWSPDGTRIAFTSSRDGNAEIYVMNADGTDVHALTSDPAWDGYPTWSPDGSRIAFQSYRDGTNQIYIMNADGTGVTRLTKSTAPAGRAVWSPAGEQIAFTVDTDPANLSGDSIDIHVINADGTGHVQLTNSGAMDNNPLWSPDGTTILFESFRDGNAEIYVMNADGTAQTNLTNAPGTEHTPVWSHDGARIAFVTYRDGNYEIYVMNADGTNPINVSNDAAYDDAPAWRRAP